MIHMTSDEMSAKLVFHVKHEAINDLQKFYDVLATQNQVMNLVGPATLPDYWSRHVLDSAQLLDRRPDARIILLKGQRNQCAAQCLCCKII